MNSPADELTALRARFGDGVELIFDGTSETCPLCRHPMVQLTFSFDVPGGEPACCENCGAVLAA